MCFGDSMDKVTLPHSYGKYTTESSWENFFLKWKIISCQGKPILLVSNVITDKINSELNQNIFQTSRYLRTLIGNCLKKKKKKKSCTEIDEMFFSETINDSTKN